MLKEALRRSKEEINDSTDGWFGVGEEDSWTGLDGEDTGEGFCQTLDKVNHRTTIKHIYQTTD